VPSLPYAWICREGTCFEDLHICQRNLDHGHEQKEINCVSLICAVSDCIPIGSLMLHMIDSAWYLHEL
jgi:hypothetical protein